jgi:hypothetical protein
MDRFPVEIIYVLVFLGIVLFNFVMQQAARRRQKEEQAQAGEPLEEAAKPPLAAEPEPLEDIWGRVPPPAPITVLPPVAAPRPAPHAVPAPPRRVHPLRALLKDKRDLRRAVILMMVLGPCRSQEPPEGR